MKTVMRYVAQIVFALFGAAVFALMLSFSFSALQRVYPESLLNQGMGLVLFDVGAVAWLIVFVWKAKGGLQRAGALVLFALDFLGTLALVTIEVLLGGQQYVAVAPWVGQSLVYIFIAATVMNLVGVYLHHLTEPAVLAEIENQSMADEVEDEARRQAGEANRRDLPALGGQLAARLRADVRERLHLPALAESLFAAPLGPAGPLSPESEPAPKGAAAQPAGDFRESEPI